MGGEWWVVGRAVPFGPIPTRRFDTSANIIWLEFGSYSNFLRKKFGFIQKMADLANLAGRLANVADCI